MYVGFLRNFEFHQDKNPNYVITSAAMSVIMLLCNVTEHCQCFCALAKACKILIVNWSGKMEGENFMTLN